MANFLFSEILDGLPAIKIVDVGPMARDETEEPYATLTKRTLARVVGFAPVEEACRQLNEAYRGKRLYLPHVIGDGTTHTFYRLGPDSRASIYQPNAALIAKFQNLGEFARVVDMRDIETVRLDDVKDAEGADYLRVGGHGAALGIYDGAEQTLAEIAVIHARVAFVPLFRRQPLFGDVDRTLRGFGFQFHRFKAMTGRTFKPLVAEGAAGGLSQQLWADAIYVKDFLQFDAVPAEKLLKLAVIAHEVYRSYDLAALALKHFDERTDAGLWTEYIKRLTSERPPAPAKPEKKAV